MTFYNQSNELEQAKYTRLYREEAEIAFSALDCVLNGEKAIYASSELTTGARFYQALREYGVKTAKDLKQKLGPEWYQINIWDRNVAAANAFAAEVRARLAGPFVITPAPFAAPGWSQPEYLAFWEALIRTRIKAAWFNSNWQFSNGCTFEFAVAQDSGLPTFDAEGKPLDLHRGIQLVAEAVRLLEADHFDTAKLRENQSHLQKIGQQTPAEVLRANPSQFFSPNT